MNYHTIIVENTQAHYFDNLSDNLYTKFRRYEDPGSVLNNDDTIKFADINTLFIVTYAEPILVFVRTTKWKKDGNTDLNRPFSQQSIVFFPVKYDPNSGERGVEG